MPRLATVLLAPLLALGLPLQAAETVLLDEDFSDLAAWTDLSTLIPWGGNPVGTSAWRVGVNNGRQAVFLSRTAPNDTTAYTGYATTTSLKTFTALDYVFPTPIQHRSQVLTIAFDARWDVLNTSGENGRLMVTLLRSRPATLSGADLSNPVGDPYGRPGLHLRIRPSSSASTKSFLEYGGGDGGRFEYYVDGLNPANHWWLPGFISNALGTGHGSPGQGSEYPYGSWKATTVNLGSTTWRRYTYQIWPDRQEVYQDGVLVGTMALPDTSATAPQYEYYETFPALRIFYRGAADTYVANLRITTQPFGNLPPTVATAAAATPAPVTGTTTALSVLGADDGGESALTYTWSTTGTPPAPVAFDRNGTNAAKNVTATFSKAGSYPFVVTIADGGGLSTSSSLTVQVDQSLTAVALTPATVTTPVKNRVTFTARANDQFGLPLATQPAVTWSATGGTVTTAGVYTAGSTTGTYAVTATTGGVGGTAPVTLTTNAAPTVATAVSGPATVTGTTAALSVLGADDGGEANLVYTWSTVGTPPATPSYNRNGSNAAKNVTVTFKKAGTYTLRATIKDLAGATVTSERVVTVQQTATRVAIAPLAAQVPPAGSTVFTASQLDQFGVAMASQPAFTWSATGGGTVSGGTYTAPATGGIATVTATVGTQTGRATAAVGEGFVARINFQPSAAAVPAGYAVDSGAVYALRANGQTYGWSAAISGVTDRNSALAADQRYDTYAPMGSATWRIAVPNGTYAVRLVVGDANTSSATYRVNAEGALFLSGSASSGARWVEAQGTVTVGDGVLDLNAGSGSSTNRIGFLEIVELPPVGAG